MSILKKLLTTLSLALLLAVSTPSNALDYETNRESGTDAEIILDLVVLRPTGFLATAAGLVIFVGSLPISIPTLSVGRAFDALVVAPAHYTFVRELGAER